MGKISLHNVRPETVFSFNNHFALPRVFILRWSKCDLKLRSFPSIRFQLPWFGRYTELHIWIWSKISFVFGIGLYSVIQSEHHTSCLIDFSDNFELVIRLGHCKFNLSFKYPFTTIFKINLKIEWTKERAIGQEVNRYLYFTLFQFA